LRSGPSTFFTSPDCTTDNGGLAPPANCTDRYALFGWSLAAGDFNGDDCDELAIGVPGEDVNDNTVSNGGALAVLFGSGLGPDACSSAPIRQDDPGFSRQE